jgi:hypothetical protein
VIDRPGLVIDDVDSFVQLVEAAAMAARGLALV